MANETSQSTKPGTDDFAQQAETSQPGFIREIIDWLKYNKKWWLIPIIAVLMLVGALVIVSGTAMAPFIYTLF